MNYQFEEEANESGGEAERFDSAGVEMIETP